MLRLLLALCLLRILGAFYQIVETANKGKIVVATKDLLPGVEILREKPLLLQSLKSEHTLPFVKHERVSGISRNLWASAHYNDMSHEKYSQFMTLYGPKNSSFAQSLRLHLSQPLAKAFCSSIDIEKFIDFNTRMHFNGMITRDGNAVFLDISKFSHSCLPNCCWERFDGDSLAVRSIRPIKSGEELTISYNEEFSMNPTHERRTQYLTSKEFLCNCERCTSQADITRRFNCFNKQCNGYHCVCQPLSTDKPYLLACSACGLTPSAEWEASMLALEQKVISGINNGDHSGGFLKVVAKAQDELLDDKSTTECPELELPLHYTAAYLLEKQLMASGRTQNKEALLIQAKQLLSLYETLIPFPCLQALEGVIMAGVALETVDTEESLQLALKTYQSVMRAAQIVNGKEILKVARLMVLAVMAKLRSRDIHLPTPDNCCAFCEASPSDMAITLSLCGRCKSVQYCGRECQVAHWKLHKELCKQCK